MRLDLERRKYVKIYDITDITHRSLVSMCGDGVLDLRAQNRTDRRRFQGMQIQEPLENWCNIWSDWSVQGSLVCVSLISFLGLEDFLKPTRAHQWKWRRSGGIISTFSGSRHHVFFNRYETTTQRSYEKTRNKFSNKKRAFLGVSLIISMAELVPEITLLIIHWSSHSIFH